MKVFLFIFALVLSLSAQARLTYPLQFGIGTDTCYLNKDKLKECLFSSPQTGEIEIPLEMAADGTVAYGYYVQHGSFRNIGYTVSVKITNFPNEKYDDTLTLNVTTWPLETPDSRQQVELEVFTQSPDDLNRLNLPGKSIGSDDDYSNIILGVRKSTKN